MPGINEQYEQRLQSHIGRTNRAIRKIYEKSIQEITISVSSVRYRNIPFSLKDYPALQKKIDAMIRKMHGSIFTIVVNSIADSWDLSNQKNNVLIDQRLAGRRPVKAVRKVIYDPNKKALEAFINRKEKGLNLSERIWNSLAPMKNEMEQSLGFSIADGKSAASTATQIKQYLNEPDRLYRRVRTEEGKLVLSPAARNYHPGRGVYRSSYKNALRVTRSENNIAYRTSDHERWQNLPFVIGIQVKLSNNHPRFDICDHLAGKYPKDFLFVGWHTQCICYSVPIMASDEDFEKMEDAILSGVSIPRELSGSIDNVPASFKKWLKDNNDRVKGWASQPYFMRDNKKYL